MGHDKQEGGGQTMARTVGKFRVWDHSQSNSPSTVIFMAHWLQDISRIEKLFATFPTLTGDALDDGIFNYSGAVKRLGQA